MTPKRFAKKVYDEFLNLFMEEVESSRQQWIGNNKRFSEMMNDGKKVINWHEDDKAKVMVTVETKEIVE
jgi:hypothetical protein